MPIEHTARGILFITLTYPSVSPGEWTEWKSQLDNWLSRVKRKFPRAAGFWKLEPQRRGAPHFHLLVVGVPFMAKEWVSRSWYEVVGSRDPRHLAAGTNVQLARSHRGVVSYAAKYTAKRQELPADWQGGVGRWWGVFNRDGLGISWDWIPLTQPDFWRAARAMRGLVVARKRAMGRAPPRWGARKRRRLAQLGTFQPPDARPCSTGTWAVLRDTHAARLVEWLDATRSQTEAAARAESDGGIECEARAVAA